MRILHIAHQYLPDHVGGTELYTQSLAAMQQDAGHTVAVLTRRDDPSPALVREADSQGVAIWRASCGELSATGRFAAAYGQRQLADHLRQVLADFQPELVHIQHLMGWPGEVGQLLRAAQIPFVVSLHDYWWVCANAQLITNDTQQLCAGPDRFVNCGRCALARAGRLDHTWAAPSLALLLAPALAWRNRLLRRTLAQAGALVAPSRTVADWYGEHLAPGTPVHVVPHGIVSGIASGSNSRVTPAEGGRPVRFVYVGGLDWQKGVHVVVQAMQGIRGAELLIAGDTGANPAYVAELRAAAPASVEILGRLDRAELWRTLAHADVLLFPSLWAESYGLVIDEAFAAGVPVLASDLGAQAERVHDGVNGLRLPPGDVAAWQRAMQDLVTDPARRAALAQGITPPLTLTDHARDIMQIYRQLLA